VIFRNRHLSNFSLSGITFEKGNHQVIVIVIAIVREEEEEQEE